MSQTKLFLLIFSLVINKFVLCDKKYFCDENCNPNSQLVCSSEETKQNAEQFNVGNARFTGKFYSEVVKTLPSSQSTIMSPFSLLFLLAQLALYTEGASHEQLMYALNLSEKKQIRCAIPPILNAINPQTTDVQLSLASKVYVNQVYELSDDFKKDTRDVFRAEAENIDCSNSQQAAGVVNKWVADQTNNRIQNILDPQFVNTDTRVILANAIYFKGKWQQPFNKNLTRDRNFYLSKDDIVQRKTMFKEGKFLYGISNDLDCQILSIPYDSTGEFSFVIYLPNKIDGLSKLQEKMKNRQLIESSLSGLRNRTVKTYLPKFTTTLTIPLNSLLGKLNITQIFSQSCSGVKGILKKSEPLYISHAIHKAFIEINEESTEATAANVGVATALSLPLPINEIIFDAHHPFAFEIRNHVITLFVGNYNGN